MTRKRISLWGAGILVSTALVLGLGVGSLFSTDNIFDQLNKYKDVLSLTKKYYVDDVDLQKLNEAAINGLLSQLDPHSAYLPPRQTKQEAERFQGSYEGVGLEIISVDDTIVVSEPMGGGPAVQMGILANDRIVKINDSSAVGLTTAQASQKLRGPRGTKVAISVLRPGVSSLIDYEITRENISITSVDVALMMKKDVGYISVNRFSATTHAEIQAALAKLHDRGMKRLILDLRGNPGGYLNEAVQMADLFLDGGTPDHPKRIVFTKARAPELEETYTARSGDPYEHLPLIVLINNGSASASEIVSGAIQDWDRGLIVGETSFGKGLVQRQWDLDDGSALRLTIARYYTPSGRLIQRSYTGKGKEEYAEEAFDRKEVEGNNLEHSQDSAILGDSLKPKFKTDGGRTVYGGGGITPDYIVKPADLTESTKNLLRHDVFFPFVTGYLDREGTALRSKFAKGFDEFKSSYHVSDEMMRDFRSFSEKKGITVDSSSFGKDHEFLAARLKAYVARSLWGEEGWFSVLLDVDAQFQKAVTLFPEAQKIARLDKPQTDKME